MSETLSDGISTLMRRMLPHGSLRTLEITSMACGRGGGGYVGWLVTNWSSV